MFLASLLVCAAPLLANRAEDQATPTDPKRIEAAVAEIEAAFKDGKTADERVAAIKKNQEVVDAKVVAAIEKGLKNKDAAVAEAAIDALGHMAHPDALDALHKFCKSDRQRLKDDEKLLPLLFKSIGRHGNEKSIELLADDPFLQRSFPAIQARVMSLGNIRSTKSVEALNDMMQKAGPNKVNDYMMLFRQALVRLTGTDQGPDSVAWTKWWQDNKTKFEVSKDVPKVPEIAEKAWNEYWGIVPKPVKTEEPKKG
jgi:hypothetical protein